MYFLFIQDTLFAYSTKHAEEFLKTHWEDEDVKTAVKLLTDEDLDVGKAVEFIKDLTEKNSNNAGLKKLQALIYQKGFENGELKSR